MERCDIVFICDTAEDITEWHICFSVSLKWSVVTGPKRWQSEALFFSVSLKWSVATWLKRWQSEVYQDTLTESILQFALVCLLLWRICLHLHCSPVWRLKQISINKTFLFLCTIIFFWGGVMLDPTQYWSMHLCGKLSSLRADSIFLHERASVFFSPDLWFSLSNSLGLAPSLVEVPAERV